MALISWDAQQSSSEKPATPHRLDGLCLSQWPTSGPSHGPQPGNSSCTLNVYMIPSHSCTVAPPCDCCTIQCQQHRPRKDWVTGSDGLQFSSGRGSRNVVWHHFFTHESRFTVQFVNFATMKSSKSTYTVGLACLTPTEVWYRPQTSVFKGKPLCGMREGATRQEGEGRGRPAVWLPIFKHLRWSMHKLTDICSWFSLANKVLIFCPTTWDSTPSLATFPVKIIP